MMKNKPKKQFPYVFNWGFSCDCFYNWSEQPQKQLGFRLQDCFVLFCFVHSLNTHWPFHAGNFPDESESQSKGIVSLTGQGDQIPGIGDGEFSIVPVQTSDKTEEGQWVDINFHTLREKLISLGLIKKNAKDFHKFGTKRTETLVCSDYAIKCHSPIFS